MEQSLFERKVSYASAYIEKLVESTRGILFRVKPGNPSSQQPFYFRFHLKGQLLACYDPKVAHNSKPLANVFMQEIEKATLTDFEGRTVLSLRF